MDRNQLYQDIAKRTQGDIYIGVVGPVRTGKSTFIKRFLDLLVLPRIEDEHIKSRVVDELPQSAAGRTIMTTQPKFVPNEAVRIDLGENEGCNVRLVDCVGYLVPGAIGHMEEGAARMVRTPWFDEDIPFEEAAEIGTKKVILEHSTIGLVITTDGTITELPRESYTEAEARVIGEMQHTGKPFVVIVNSTEPEGEAAQILAAMLEERYQARAICLNVMQMSTQEANLLLEEILLSFPLRLLEVRLPSFMRALPAEHWLMQRVMLPVYSVLPQLREVRDYRTLAAALSDIEQFDPCRVQDVRLGEGVAQLTLQPDSALFYQVLSEECGCDIHDDYQLMSALKSFSAAKTEYDRVEQALSDARLFGYGLVPPAIDEMELDEPMIVQQGNRFGVKLRAHASGLHVIRVDIDSEVNPIVGTEQQSEALVQYLSDTFTTDPQAIWQTNIFGKPLYDLVREGMEGKVGSMPEEVRMRMQATLQRIVNEGCNGLICIML
ncbi:MAG: stage IV sporulation protein A [Clostridia bacterium]|nr:stage IV sporulation protein A [Clostridia bacterium]